MNVMSLRDSMLCFALLTVSLCVICTAGNKDLRKFQHGGTDAQQR